MNLKHLSNEELHSQTLSAAYNERMSTMEVLWHLREINRRMFYAQKGFRDLKEYCVKELKYSEGSAWRRISAMKLLVEVPEIQEKIESGTLNLTQVSMAKAHFREVKASKEEKTRVLLNLENQTARGTERFLAECKPESYIPKPEVVEKAMRGQRLEVTLVLDKDLQDELEEIQILLGKPLSKLELLKLLAKKKLESLKKENERKAQPARRRAAVESSDVPPKNYTKKCRYISKITLREVKRRDDYRCQYRDSKTNSQCTAQQYLQIEHKIPFAKGGAHTPENLQLLCANHNRLRALQQFGEKKMQNYLPGLMR